MFSRKFSAAAIGAAAMLSGGEVRGQGTRQELCVQAGDIGAAAADLEEAVLALT